jgi:hypothetical protein
MSEPRARPTDDDARALVLDVLGGIAPGRPWTRWALTTTCATPRPGPVPRWPSADRRYTQLGAAGVELDRGPRAQLVHGRPAADPYPCPGPGSAESRTSRPLSRTVNGCPRYCTANVSRRNRRGQCGLTHSVSCRGSSPPKHRRSRSTLPAIAPRWMPSARSAFGYLVLYSSGPMTPQIR